MAEPEFGMDKAEFRKLLVASKKQPVQCGVGMTKDGVVIKLDRIKAGRALTTELQKTHKDMKSPHWGTASVDVDEDPKLVVLMLNKPASGMAKRLKKILKGTGFSKIEIRLEDGSVAEKLGEEEDAQETAGEWPGSGQSSEIGQPSPDRLVQTATPPPPVAPPEATASPRSGPDTAFLTRRLTDLVKRIAAADPARIAVLKPHAVQAQASLKSGDAQGASEATDRLEHLLAQEGPIPSGQAVGPKPPATPSPTIAKARQVWVATRQKVGNDIDRLHGAFHAAFQGHGRQADLSKAFRARVDGVLGTLDEALAHKLDAVQAAIDPAERAKLVAEAHTLIDGYSKHVASDPTIAAVDKNPFTPLSLRNTLTASLAAVSKAIG